MENLKLINILKIRFEDNMHRHSDITWDDVFLKLSSSPEKLKILDKMEKTGGEPDLVAYDKKTNEYIFYDCSPESPLGRRSICYDSVGEEIRKKKGIYPNGNAQDMAKEIGIEILSEVQYRELQKLGEFDKVTSSWIKTPDDIRDKGGAIFADYHYGHVFIYHNSSHSFYSSRGFRGSLRV